MKTSLIIIALVTFSFSALARSGQKAIYGSLDNEFTSNNSPEKIKIMATGISYIIPKKNISRYDKTTSVIRARRLSEVNNLCSHERFAHNYISGPNCTGFLVGENLLVTAGHCIKDKNDCKNFNMAFGVTVAKETTTGFRIANSNIYSCKKIIKTVEDDQKDYALIQLDRKVKARHIFTLADDSNLTTDSSVYMIGHPLGLAAVYSKAGPVVATYSDFSFRAKIDSFAGNSGSPVFDAKTNEVVGVFSGGQEDFIKVSNRCTRYARYESGSEGVTRIRFIKEILDQ